MKGMSLPIDVIVVVAIAVLVLVVVAAFFILVVIPDTQKISDQDAWNTGCSQATARGCLLADFGLEPGVNPLPIVGYDPDGDRTPNSILDACFAIYGYTEENDCRNACCGQ
ncbi:MAG: hypothetical protein NT129_03815 [Candidatus Aenigmarchaeota archaeon]|nr:hypothetical protein [Candidatus Aenigmarchaeota archaeon]